MTDFWGGLGNAAGQFAQGIGSVFTAPFNGGKDLWANASKNPYSYTAPKPSGGGKGSTGSTGGGRDYAAELKAALANLAAASRPYVPKPEVVRSFKYDTNAGLAKAKEMAGNALNPIYQQSMNNYLNRDAVELANKNLAIGQERTDLGTTMDRVLQDSATSRTRNSADTASNIAEIGASQAVAARDNGLTFDSANRMLNEGLGAAGVADSGLGAQQSADAQDKMTRMSNEEVRQSDNKVVAANTLLSRSFEDLATKDTRAGQDKASGNTRLDIDINTFMDKQKNDLTDFTFNQEKTKAEGLAAMTSAYQNQLASQWIQTLSGQGATGAEIQLASNTYR